MTVCISTALAQSQSDSGEDKAKNMQYCNVTFIVHLINIEKLHKLGPKFTDDLRTILKQFSNFWQSHDNWRIHRKFSTILRLS